MRIAILTPTRNRPEGLLRLWQSIENTKSKVNDIEILAGVDEDDPKFTVYSEMVGKYKGLNIFLLPKGISLGAMWNYLSKQVKADYYACGNDDYIFETKDWDEILTQHVKGKHPYYLYWFDDGIQHGNHCAFPIVSDKWINTLGYYFPTNFIHNYVDTWVNEIAEKTNVKHYIPEVKTKHLHYSTGASEYDETYQKGMANDSNNKDRIEFERTEHIRNNEVLKLTKCIKEWEQQHS